MGFVKEFKDFAMRGNVMDMAIGIIIGGAFGKIVASLVKDVLMPVVGKATGGTDFSQLYIPLGKLADGSALPEGSTLAEAAEAGVATMNYGNFIQTAVDFFFIALAIFVMIKIMNSAKKKEEEKPAAPAEPPAQEKLLGEIRDLLKKG